MALASIRDQSVHNQMYMHVARDHVTRQAVHNQMFKHVARDHVTRQAVHNQAGETQKSSLYRMEEIFPQRWLKPIKCVSTSMLEKLREHWLRSPAAARME